MSAVDWIVRGVIGAVCNIPAYVVAYRWGKRDGWNKRQAEVLATLDRVYAVKP